VDEFHPTKGTQMMQQLCLGLTQTSEMMNFNDNQTTFQWQWKTKLKRPITAELSLAGLRLNAELKTRNWGCWWHSGRPCPQWPKDSHAHTNGTQ